MVESSLIYIHIIFLKTLSNTFLNLNVGSIRLFDSGVAYQNIPDVLEKYHIGIILHKGDTLNYIYNAPNKLFEYLKCGLDVWFPNEMHGIYPFEREDALPKIVKTDFQNLKDFDFEKAIEVNGLPWKPFDFCYEQIFPELLRELSS